MYIFRVKPCFGVLQSQRIEDLGSRLLQREATLFDKQQAILFCGEVLCQQWDSLQEKDRLVCEAGSLRATKEAEVQAAKRELKELRECTQGQHQYLEWLRDSFTRAERVSGLCTFRFASLFGHLRVFSNNSFSCSLYYLDA